MQLAEIKVSYNPKIKPSERLMISGSSDINTALRKVWSYPLELKECFYAIYLNRSNRVLGFMLVSVGGLTGTIVDVRNILQTALKANACSVILAHNHPSGNPNPSEADIQITRRGQ